MTLRSPYRRTSRRFDVNAPSLKTGWLNVFVVTIGTMRPVSSRAFLSCAMIWSRSAAFVPYGTRSSSWNVTPYAPTSASL